MIERAEALGEMDGAAEGGEQDGDAKSRALGESRGIRQRGHGIETCGAPEELFLGPEAVKAEGVRPGHDLAHEGQVHPPVRKRLRDGESDLAVRCVGHSQSASSWTR